jgi:hypothetical protein
LHEIFENTANFADDSNRSDADNESEQGSGALASLVEAESSTAEAREHLLFDADAALFAQANIDGYHALPLLESAWSAI